MPIPSHPISALRPLLLGCLILAACGGDDPADAGPRESVRVIFDLRPAPMDFGTIPWPDDLYRDDAGRIEVGALPGEDRGPVPEYFDALRVGLADLDGFGAVSPVFFRLDGPIDPTSLPATPADTLREDASVLLLDVDPSSASAFSRTPVDVAWLESAGRLSIRPDDGHPLAEGRRYAAVVTRRVRAADGRAVEPAEAFGAVRDASTRPEDALAARAYAQYGPVLASLAANGIAREEVAGLAVFTVQTVTRDLVDARERIWEGAPPRAALLEAIAAGPDLDARLGLPASPVAGLDVEGGVLHSAVGWMIHGTFSAPCFVASVPGVHGHFSRDDTGRLEVKGTETVPFTLLLPRAGDMARLPVVIFEHGLGGDRSQALALANALNGAGYAVIAPDMPYHGMRFRGPDVDTVNRFTGAEVPDGFGDRAGLTVVVNFVGIEDTAGDLISFHPAYLRESLRQATAELLALARLVREGDLSAIAEVDPSLSAIAFASDPMAAIGYSLGGMVTTMFAASEPEVGAALLAVTGGSFMRAVIESPPFNLAYVPILWPILGLEPFRIDYLNDPPIFEPAVAIWQTLLDRGDPINYGRPFASRQIDVLMPMARHDETFNNVATESLARVLGAAIVNGEPGYADLPVAEAPVRHNTPVDGAMATRALFVYEPATHGLMLERGGISRYEHPVRAPFQGHAETTVENPVDASQAQMLHFLESWRSGVAEVAAR